MCWGHARCAQTYVLFWTASVVVIVDENASGSKDEWSISVPGCSPSSADFNESGDAITSACTKTSTETSESFDITVDGLD